MNYIIIYKIAGFDMPGYSIQAELDGAKLERMKYYGYSKRDAVLGEFEKEIAFDQMILSSASEQEINEVACLILDTLVNSNKSPIYRDGKKQRVPNVYNGGYHYETIYRPERFATIDF